MVDRIAEIEARLAAVPCDDPYWFPSHSHEPHEEDFCAHAPADLRYLLDELAKARAACAAYERVWWMAERYAEGGGSGGPEQRDLDEARAEIDGKGGG